MRKIKDRSVIAHRFYGSGLSRKAFAERHGIALSTLSYWLRQEKRRTGSVAVIRPEVVFSELKVSPESLGRESRWGMEVVSPTGLRVRSREMLSTEVLIRLLCGGEC
jgi:transposase-like protein